MADWWTGPDLSFIYTTLELFLPQSPDLSDGAEKESKDTVAKEEFRAAARGCRALQELLQKAQVFPNSRMEQFDRQMVTTTDIHGNIILLTLFAVSPVYHIHTSRFLRGQDFNVLRGHKKVSHSE